MSSRYVSSAFSSDDLSLLAPPALQGVEAKIYGDLCHAIARHDLMPGAKLDEAILWDIYSVSRTVVRKVLVVLETEGIVSLPLNRGAFVATPSRYDADDLIDVVGAWMFHIVQDMALDSSHLSKDQVARLNKHLMIELEAENSLQFEDCFRLSWEFWLLLSLIHGNRIQSRALDRYLLRLPMALIVHQRHQASSFQPGLSAALLQQILAKESHLAIDGIRRKLETTRQSLRSQQTELDLRGILLSKR